RPDALHPLPGDEPDWQCGLGRSIRGGRIFLWKPAGSQEQLQPCGHGHHRNLPDPDGYRAAQGLAGFEAPRLTRKYLISGRVQGVGFRYFVLRQATSLSLVGWTRNLPNGSVEVVAKGDEAALAALESALDRGPSHAKVDHVEKAQISDEHADVNGFEIR